MFSRRDFLGSAALGLGGLILPGEANKEEEKNQENELPDPITKLSTMKDQARPITSEERRARIGKACRLMKKNDMGALLLMGGTTLDYFTGIKWRISERMLAVVLTQDGAAFIVCPAFEEARAKEQIEGGPLDNSTSIRTWQEHENPYHLVADGLRERGLATSRLGIEETVRFVFSNGIADEAPSLTLASATPVTAGCRGEKDGHELELMSLASEVTWKAYQAAYESMEEGMDQEEFSRLIARAHDQLGFSGYASVQVGKYAALPHGSKTPQTIREGQPVLIDGGCTVEGYWSDLSRTFMLGKPTDKMEEVFDIVRKAQDAALQTAEPGIEAQKVDAAARTAIAEAGYGPGYKYFTHRLGHGIGMDMHEWPYLVKGNTTVLEPGMTFSNEPGIYIPDEFGVRLEDDLVITEEGAKLLSPQSNSFEEPFGKWEN